MDNSPTKEDIFIQAIDCSEENVKIIHLKFSPLVDWALDTTRKFMKSEKIEPGSIILKNTIPSGFKKMDIFLMIYDIFSFGELKLVKVKYRKNLITIAEQKYRCFNDTSGKSKEFEAKYFTRALERRANFKNKVTK